MNSKATKRMCAKCQFEDDTGLKICPRDGSPMTARAKDPLIGQVIDDKYEILSMLGKGGMSVVYKAKHTMMNRMVAVKMLRPELVAVPQLLQRFKQESNAVSALRHPNIVTVFDYGLMDSSGTPYLIMDYLEGDTLNTVLKKEHHFAPERAIGLFAQACDALAHAHDQGVIHRDIKPSNLLIRVDKNGEEALTIFDFGIAKMLGQDGSTIHKLTTSGEVFGSPLYMSPEQCSGEHVSKKTDTYSLACVFYETLCGQPPLGGTSPMETLMKHVNEDPPMLGEVNQELDIPQGLEDAIMQALSKDPAERQTDMREFRDQILEAGNLRMLSSSLHLTRENTLAGVASEDVVASAPSRQTSSVPAPKKRTTQRSQQVPPYKGKQKNQQDEPKKIPTAVIVALAVVIALGAMGGIVFTLMKNNEAIVVSPEQPVDEETSTSTNENFDEKSIKFAKLKTNDTLQLSSIPKEFQCRIDFDGNLLSAIPSPLLATPYESTSGHTDMKCIGVPVDVTPSDIGCTQAAEALFKKLFPNMKDDAWVNITDRFGDEIDDGNVLIQEITFPPEEAKKAEAATGEAAGSSEKPAEADATTEASDEAAEEAKADAEEAKADAEEAAEDAEPKASGEAAPEAAADSSPKVYKEYFLYIKHNNRLLACQFIPLKATEKEMEQTIKQLVPYLRKVVKT